MAKNSVVEIAKEIVAKHGLSQKDAEFFVSAVFEQIYDGLGTDDVVKVKGLGTFKVIEVRDRESVNVNTGERVVIEGHNKISFVPDTVMRDFVNKPFAQFETVIINDGVDIEELNNVQDITVSSDSEDVDVSEQSALGTNIDDSGEKSLSEILDEPYDADLETKIVEENVNNEDTVDEGVSKESTESLKEDDTETIAFAIQNEDEEQILSSDKQYCIEENEDKTMSPITENNVCINEKDDSANDICFFSRNRCFFVFFMILICAVSSFVGYYIGLNRRPEVVVKYVKMPVPKKTENTTVLKSDLKDSVNNDTVTKDIKDELNIISEEDVSEIRKKDSEGSEPKSKSMDETSALNTAKNMVRTGAYRILGTDRMVVIKNGETLRKISKFYLGDGMECYVQVHNGIVEVKDGQKIKIPKLELKKKK